MTVAGLGGVLGREPISELRRQKRCGVAGRRVHSDFLGCATRPNSWLVSVRSLNGDSADGELPSYVSDSYSTLV